MPGKHSVSTLLEQAEPANDPGAHQRPLPPSAGYLAEIDSDPYPSFPTKPLDRIDWAMDAPIASSPAKMVSIILAKHADKTGRAWPSISTIAQRASLAERTVKVAVKHLEATGRLTALRHPRRTTSYWLKSPADRVCEGCWTAVPARADLCPSCGRSGVQELHLKRQ